MEELSGIVVPETMEAHLEATTAHTSTLKIDQTAALSAVVKKMSELSRLMTNSENLHLVKSELEKFSELHIQYSGCFQKYITSVTNSGECDKEKEDHAEKIRVRNASDRHVELARTRTLTGQNRSHRMP